MTIRSPTSYGLIEKEMKFSDTNLSLYNRTCKHTHCFANRKMTELRTSCAVAPMSQLRPNSFQTRLSATSSSFQLCKHHQSLTKDKGSPGGCQSRKGDGQDRCDDQSRHYVVQRHEYLIQASYSTIEVAHRAGKAETFTMDLKYCHFDLWAGAAGAGQMSVWRPS